MGLLVVAFAVFATVVVVALVAYMRRRLVVDPFAPGRQRRVAGWLLAGSVAVTFGTIFATRISGDSPLSGTAMVGYVMLAVYFYAALALLAAELPRLAWSRWERSRSTGPASDGSDGSDDAVGPAVGLEAATGVEAATGDDADPGAEATGPATEPGVRTAEGQGPRERTVARVVAGGAVAIGFLTAAVGFAQARDIETRRVTIEMPRADAAVDGLRIAVLADLHLTVGLRDRAWMADVVERVNALEPDLVVIVGDLVDGSVAELGDDAEPLADLDSTYGSVFVTGNHEFISGAQQWVDHLPKLDVAVLRNDHIEIGRNGTSFILAGVDDVTGEDDGHGPDIEAAVEEGDPDQTVILLSHQPVLAEEAAEHGVDLQISGHTHGGQMWPIHYLVRLQQGHVAGTERVGDMTLYTSRGVGSWGPPVRVGAPPEITLLTLDAG